MTKKFDIRFFLGGFFACVALWLAMPLLFGNPSPQALKPETAEPSPGRQIVTYGHRDKSTKIANHSIENTDFRARSTHVRGDHHLDNHSYSRQADDQQNKKRSSFHPLNDSHYSGMRPHELERALSEILIDGLTDDQINSFVEGPADVIESILQHETYLIPSVLGKITDLETSVERDYFIALIGGLPRTQRLPVIEKLATYPRPIDQEAVIHLYKSGNNQGENNNRYLLELYHNADYTNMRLPILSALSIEQGIESDIFNQIIFSLSDDKCDETKKNLSIIKNWLKQSGDTFNDPQRDQLEAQLAQIANDHQRHVDNRIIALKYYHPLIIK